MIKAQYARNIVRIGTKSDRKRVFLNNLAGSDYGDRRRTGTRYRQLPSFSASCPGRCHGGLFAGGRRISRPILPCLCSGSSALTVKKVDDFAYIKDATFLKAAFDLGLLDKGQRDTLQDALDLRNKCGHPTKYKPRVNKARGFIEDVVGIVFE
jgi:hypothetical protein